MTVDGEALLWVIVFDKCLSSLCAAQRSKSTRLIFFILFFFFGFCLVFHMLHIIHLKMKRKNSTCIKGTKSEE